MSRRLRNESGQALVLTAIFLVMIMGATGLAVDVGSWYRQSRQAQSTADAAALSGAENLQTGTASAQATAQNYADQNGGGVAPGGITFQSAFSPNDTVSVKIIQTAPGFFSRIFGIDSVNVHAHAAARIAVPQEVSGAAPILIQKDHPMLTGAGCGNPTSPPTPCFGDQTSIPLGKIGSNGSFVSGSFGLVDLPNYYNGNCANAPNGGGGDGSSTVGGWIQTGYNGYLDLGCYAADTGAKFNSNSIEDALTARLGSTLLFPVYDTVFGGGNNAYYNVIGWAAYYITGWAAGNASANLPGYTCTAPGGGGNNGNGTNGSVCGYFTQITWAGIQSSSAPTDPDYGVRSVSLVN